MLEYKMADAMVVKRVVYWVVMLEEILVAAMAVWKDLRKAVVMEILMAEMLAVLRVVLRGF